MHYKQIYVCLCRRSNCSSNLFLRSESACSNFGMIEEKWRKMRPNLLWFGQWGLSVYVHLVFSYSLLAIITIEWGSLYIDYMRNRERGTQVTGPNLNGLGLIYNGSSFLDPNTI